MNIQPKFRVHELEGTMSQEIIDYVPKQIQTGAVQLANGKTEKQFKIVRERVIRQVQQAAGYLVMMARGHSIRVKSKQDLQRLGFAETPPLIDMETGEEVPDSHQYRNALPIGMQLGNGYNPKGAIEEGDTA